VPERRNGDFGGEGDGVPASGPGRAGEEGDQSGAGKRYVRGGQSGSRNVDPPIAGERDVNGSERGARNVRPPRETVGHIAARLAKRGQGVASRSDLLDAGVSRHAIERKIRTGELHRVHRGVYLVGHAALAPRAEEFAALLAYGDGALISHQSAAYLWSMIEHKPQDVDVTLVGRRRRPKAKVRLHVLGRLTEDTTFGTSTTCRSPRRPAR
jgi:hypothetical protein